MKLSDIVQGPWAITPSMFNEVQGIYATHMRGEKIELSSLEARLGRPLNNVRADVDVVNGVAVIPIEGVIAKRMNLFSQISGGTSTQVISRQLAEALADDSVNAIILAIDSPGGTVDGTQALADQIEAARGTKPIYAHTDGQMCSAAYWIGCAADKVFIAGDTTMVGSIGVISTHVDQSMAEAQRGFKITEIKAGKYKGTGSPHKSLGAGETVMQEAVDHIYSVFLDTVARNRGVDVEQTQQDMAEGRVFLGQTAIAAGLVDGVATLDQLIAKLAGGNSATANYSAARDGVSSTAMASTQEDTMKITIEQVRADAPDVAKALHDEGFTAGKADGHGAGRAEGGTAELARVKEVLALPARGHEKLKMELALDGKTTRADAAIQLLDAQEKAQTARVDGLAADAKDAGVAPAAAAPVDEKKAAAINPHELAAKARAYQDEQMKLGRRVSDIDAINHVSKGA